MLPAVRNRFSDLGAALKGTELPSELQPGVTYRISHVLGGGGMSVAFFAMRLAPDGQMPVVVKVLGPNMVRGAGNKGLLAVRKEAVALGRLNERVPPTPFVVRLVDVGSLPFEDAGTPLELPWLAIEYVHGGAEGTTLEERVESSLEQTGHAFDPERAAHAVECLGQGLTAIHEVGVIHRDIKPDNVLCCSFGAEELFKIADFGIARPLGMQGTFGTIRMGAPGYAAPEQLLGREVDAASDVFSFAAVIHYLLTGEHFFEGEGVREIMAAIKNPERRSITERVYLSPLLRERPEACAVIDAALAQATAFEREHRMPSVAVLANIIVPALRSHAGSARSSGPLRRTLLTDVPPSTVHLMWTPRHFPGEDRVIRGAAWDGDGQCMTVTPAGLSFWDGIAYRPVPDTGALPQGGIHFVLRVDAGAWLVGGDGGLISLCTPHGTTTMMRGPDPEVRLVLASGDMNELCVFVGTQEAEPPMLYCLAAGHWIKPAVLRRAASVSSLSRLDGERWIVTGRTRDGEGFAVIYEPLRWEVRRIKVPECRAYLAAATRSDLGLGMIVGAGGRTVRLDGEGLHPAIIEGEPDLSITTIDPARRIWAASAGAIWVQDPFAGAVWRRVFAGDGWNVPFVSMFADVGRVVAMTADGGILEGRAPATTLSIPPPPED
jgi:serine/threonine protein kinase